MGENSKIEWCDHTFNHVRGCTKVSPECANCYAETLSGRNPKTLGVWGPDGTRVVAAESAWKGPLKWNKAAACECGGGFQGAHSPYCPQADRPRVFCASLADVFEDWTGPMLNSRNERLAALWDLGWGPYNGDGFDAKWLTMRDVRARLFRLIDATPNLDWLLLTKRPENITQMMPGRYGCPVTKSRFDCNCEFCSRPRPNVWLGTTVGVRACLSRLDHLRAVPAAVRFVSFEPLLEDLGKVDLTGIHWAIVGGESGAKRRPCEIAWFESLRDQCRAAGVKFFVKQDSAFASGKQGRIPLALWQTKEFPEVPL